MTLSERSNSTGLKHVLTSPALGAFFLGYVLTLTLTVCLHLAVDRSSWHMELPRSFRSAVVAWAVIQTLPLAALVGAAAMMGRAGGSRRGLLWALLLSVPLFVFLASWAMFWATGEFLNADAVAFGMASPASTLAHIVQLSPGMLILVPLGALTLSGLLTFSARRMSPTPWLGLLALAGVVITGISYQGNATAEGYLLRSTAVMPHPEVGTPLQVGELMEDLRDDRSGPIAHLLASRMHGSLASTASDRIGIDWRSRRDGYEAGIDRRLNVIVLIVESLRSDELRAYGGSLDVMPAVDDLARESLVFIDHQAVSSHSSYSSVVPVSSQFPLRDSRLHLYPKNPTYPRILLYDLLQPLGYRTAIISSQNEAWGGMANFLASEHIDHFFHAETFEGSTYIPDEDAGFARFASTYGRAGKIDDRLTVDEAIRWIGEDTRRPFFAYINLQNSHVPYPIPADAPTPFGPRRPSFPIRFNFFPVDSAEVVRGVYRNSLHYVDMQIARLVGHLKATGQWEHTILAVMGDHGQAFFEHGFAAHGNQLYEELLRTPLIMHVPGLEPGVRQGLAQHVDVAPTILDVLGMPPHPGFQGVSLLSERRVFAYATVQTPMANQYSVSDGRFKLVLDGRSGSSALRDLALDPAESLNWATRMPGIAVQLRERVETWHALQIEYYSNPLLQVNRFAPVLQDLPAVVLTRSD